MATTQVPILAVFGRLATDDERQRLGRAQIEEGDGDGHCVHVIDPGRFATRLGTFVQHCNQAG